MSERVIIWNLVCTTVLAIFTPLVGALVLLIFAKIRTMEKKVSKVETGLHTVATGVNGMQESLLRAKGAAAFAAGERSERANPLVPLNPPENIPPTS